MGAELYTTTAVDTYEGLTGNIQIDCIHRTSLSAFPAVDAQIFFDHHSSTVTLSKSSGGANLSTGRWITRKAGFCLETGEIGCRQAVVLGQPDRDDAFESLGRLARRLRGDLFWALEP